MGEDNNPIVSMNSRFKLNPLSQQVEDGVLIVGYSNQFLELPLAGARFIEWLNEGASLAVARARFEILFNPFPDDEVMDVMEAFLACGFIAEIDGRTITPPRSAHKPKPSSQAVQRFSRLLFSQPMLIGWLLFVIPAIFLLVGRRDLWPQPHDYFWHPTLFVIILAGIIIGFVNLGIHEGFHWLACQAKGIQATISWGQRWGFIPVAQTEMHTIWAVPRSHRYLPIAAGMIWDIFLMSCTIYMLIFHTLGYIALSAIGVTFLKYMLLGSVLSLAGQFWLFAKMDGYYLLSALFGQRNLQADTVQWLKSKLTVRHSFAAPTNGKTIIYLYAVILFVGGGLFVGQFLLITLPIKLQLLWQALDKLLYPTQLFDVADGAAILLSQAIYFGLLAYVHGRSALHRRQTKQSTQTLTPAHTPA